MRELELGGMIESVDSRGDEELRDPTVAERCKPPTFPLLRRTLALGLVMVWLRGGYENIK